MQIEVHVFKVEIIRNLFFQIFFLAHIYQVGIVSAANVAIKFPGEISMVEILQLSATGSLGSGINSDGQCTFGRGQTAGYCVSLDHCRELTVFVDLYGLKHTRTIKLLKSRSCSIVGDDVNFCCITPSNITKSVTKSIVPDITSIRPVVTPVSSGTSSVLESTFSPLAKVQIPSMEVCGQSYDDRIVLGTATSPGQHPWLVGVGYFRGKKYKNVCGGTLITKRHVLTAAHCFLKQPSTPFPSHVVLGEHSLTKDIEVESPIWAEIAKRSSPGYNRTTHLNDIELLTLDKDIGFTDFIRPACLPFGFEKSTFETSTLTIVGWGDTSFRSFVGNDIPLEAQISVVSKPQCKEAYSRAPEVPFDDTQICAGLGLEDACQGDSGGPMLYFEVEEHFRTFVIGIVSFGVECGNPTYPGVYTFVPQFLPWIQNNI